MSKSSVKLKCQLWLQHSCYRFGRRLAVVASCVPLVLGWLVTWQASQLGHLYIARSDQTWPSPSVSCRAVNGPLQSFTPT